MVNGVKMVKIRALLTRCYQGFLYSSRGGGSLKCGLIRIAPTSGRLKKFWPINLCRLPITLFTILAKHIVINISKNTLLMQYNTMSIATTVQCKFQQIKSISIMPCAPPIPLNSAVYWIYPSLLKHVAPLQDCMCRVSIWGAGSEIEGARSETRLDQVERKPWMLPIPNEFVVWLKSFCAKFRQSRIKIATARAHTDRENTGDLIIYPMLCYSNGTDND